jgi:hypothetical protein
MREREDSTTFCRFLPVAFASLTYVIGLSGSLVWSRARKTEQPTTFRHSPSSRFHGHNHPVADGNKKRIESLGEILSVLLSNDFKVC